MGGFKRKVARLLAILLTTILLIPSNITVFAAEVGKEFENQKNPAVSEQQNELEEVLFNTGSKVYHVVSMDNFFYNEKGDAFFEEDGSYTIEIPEDNPFFPYEVQFTYHGKVTNQWFLTPDDSVEIGGHTFYVSANFDNTVVTQMNLKVADDIVTVYPEKKEFTDGEGIDPLSLLPLTERKLTVDLSSYTPAELTMVSLDTIFTGENVLNETEKVAWTYGKDGDHYLIANAGDTVDLSYHTYYGSSIGWQMIVGEADQLAETDVRNIITVEITSSRRWLTPTVYIEDNEGIRSNAKVVEQYYYDYNVDRQLNVKVPSESLDNIAQAYLGLDINREIFPAINFQYFKVYEGKYSSASEALSGNDITESICNANLDQAGSGYKISEKENSWITIVTFDQEDRVTGCLPFKINLMRSSNHISYGFLYTSDGTDVVKSTSYSLKNGCRYTTHILYNDYSVNDSYYQRMSYYRYDEESSFDVTAAYEGQYSSIAGAEAAGALDIKEELFGNKGYLANYSEGVYFSVFVGSDEEQTQEKYFSCIKAKTDSKPEPTLSSSTAVRFTGLIDSDGKTVPAYIVEQEEDSYSEFNYWTILVQENTDLTKLAPTFYTYNKMNLYAEGGSSPEVSGKSYHDFSKGYVQYTSAAENGKNAKNYWLQIVKPSSVTGKLYINSLTDSVANTRIDNNIVYSKREVNLDGYHDYEHNILIMNMGEEAIDALSVNLISDVLELDEYWTLQGKHSLSGFDGVEQTTIYGELPNLAKIRIHAKENIENGTEASGQLIIKSGNTIQMVLTLTGIVGDPCITTKEIPEAVKYVPYGTMIQNNNKYGWNQVSYRLKSGKLPKGMELKENGELYGVPQEAGEFTFTLRAINSYGNFSDSEATLTLLVKENTNSNVYTSSDNGYIVEQPIGVENITGSYDYILREISDQIFISSGEYGEFIDFWLNGVKLVDGEDYTKDSGSTRITIRSQTFRDKAQTGTNTIAAEFRVEGDTSKELKRTAQNFRIEMDQPDNDSSDKDNDNSDNNNDYDSSDDNDNSDDDTSDENSSSNTSSNSNSSSNTNDNKENNDSNIQENNTSVINSDNLWVQDDTGWWCSMPDGSYPKNTWYQMSYKGTVGWYFFNEQGYMVVGWFFDNGQWYYLNPESGEAQGRMCTSWQKVGDNWCYFNNASDGKEGALVSNTWKQLTFGGNTDWYYFDTEGYMTVGWIFKNNKWYYLNPVSDGTKGKMYTGWQFIDGKWYYFSDTSEGTMGTLVTDAWIGDYYVDQNGVWTK